MIYVGEGENHYGPKYLTRKHTDQVGKKPMAGPDTLLTPNFKTNPFN